LATCNYFVAGRTELLAPRLEVKGLGAIALPLLPVQAKQLIRAATRAPHGRGSDTIIDTNVRRTWQIAAGRVRIGGKHWGQTLADVVSRATEGLGVAEPVTAELYKLLVYDKGSFFVSHRDTEKAPGMFATLVVALPSQSEGGDLIVRHKNREARLDLSCNEPSELAFAAFYADCVHEVLPVTRGCRATLVFNLVRIGKGAAPQPPNYEAETAQTADLLSAWAKAKARPHREPDDSDVAEDRDSSPQQLVYPLEHAYTPAELRAACWHAKKALATGNRDQPRMDRISHLDEASNQRFAALGRRALEWHAHRWSTRDRPRGADGVRILGDVGLELGRRHH
jgi:predicted 2-oxoglutarate/Fe(II)-dependent dioxygenase YbiX